MPSSVIQQALSAECSAAAWDCIDFLSDLHLHEGDTGQTTAAAFCAHLASTPADALFLLGDVFEVWVGDDAATPDSFEARMADAIRASRAQVFFMAGNRDFLLGDDYAQAAGMTRLSDPARLDLGSQHWLLTHGDAWCLDDVDYQQFRSQVRTPAWQAALLAKPLPERQAIGRAMREASASKQAQMSSHADVDTATAVQALQTSGAQVLLHGHTHHPAIHPLPGARQRLVLSDWDLAAQPPRADFIRLTRDDTGWLAQRGVLQPESGSFFLQPIKLPPQ